MADMIGKVYANGGYVGDVVAVDFKLAPAPAIPVTYHLSGRAVDVADPGANMRAAAAHISSKYGAPRGGSVIVKGSAVGWSTFVAAYAHLYGFRGARPSDFLFPQITDASPAHPRRYFVEMGGVALKDRPWTT